MDVLARLDETRAAINVLEHPFYQRWSAGELSAGELALLRRRVPPRGGRAGRRLRPGGVLRLGAGGRIGAGRRCERGPAPPRRGGGGARGAVGPVRARPRPAARARRRRARAADGRVRARRGRPARTCSSTWRCCTRSRPASRRSRRRSSQGLTEHYGFSEEGPATEYFRVHELRDVEHAREARRADRAADGRGGGPRGAGGADAGARERGAARQLAAAGRGRSGGLAGLWPAGLHRPRGQPPREQHGGDGRGEVEAGHARAHGDADARVGARSISSGLRPWRSVPNASTARAGSSAGSSGSPSGSIASSGRSARARSRSCPSGGPAARRARRSAARRRRAARRGATGRGCRC